ncbi:hypothetical protein BDZ89DRAFT_764280 [Hymenopellis radicata]|nr:hypothetical protein BDZ89DRAFT_764280 [Hymenopellis radicata]
MLSWRNSASRRRSEVLPPIVRSTWNPARPTRLQDPDGSQSYFTLFTSHAFDMSREESSAIYAGGARHGGTGFFVQPTVFSETNNMREEIFASIIKFTAAKDDDFCRSHPDCQRH